MIRCVKNGECLADIALCVTGAVEGVWALAVRNGVSVTAELRNGMELAWLPDDDGRCRCGGTLQSRKD